MGRRAHPGPVSTLAPKAGHPRHEGLPDEMQEVMTAFVNELVG